MITKTITIRTKQNCSAIFLERQCIWNHKMLRQGCLNIYVVASPDSPEEITIFTVWANRESLDHFMKSDHDDLVAKTRIHETYDECQISIQQVIQYNAD